MPEDATLAALQFLLVGALTVEALRRCAIRVTMSKMSMLPVGWVSAGVLTCAVSSAAVWSLGLWAKSAEAGMTSWTVLAGLWMVAMVAYFFAHIAKRPVR